jgi:hypothetical protein
MQAETSEDLFEWKTALEEALAQAPNAALVMGHNGIFRNDTADTYEGATPNCWSNCTLAFFSTALKLCLQFNYTVPNCWQGERRGQSSH